LDEIYLIRNLNPFYISIVIGRLKYNFATRWCCDCCCICSKEATLHVRVV
jgi:hypothetical protein